MARTRHLEALPEVLPNESPSVFTVIGGCLPQFTETWALEAREEEINSSHWWLGVITDLQFRQFTGTGPGVNTRGIGEGMSFEQGYEGEGELSRKGELLCISFSGDSTSPSLT